MKKWRLGSESYFLHNYMILRRLSAAPGSVTPASYPTLERVRYKTGPAALWGKQSAATIIQ